MSEQPGGPPAPDGDDRRQRLEERLEQKRQEIEQKLGEKKQEIEQKLEEKKEEIEEKLKQVKRSLASRITRGTLLTLGTIVLVLCLLFGLFAWYTTTPDFEHRVERQVVSVLENATGGRVEIKRIQFHLWHLAIQADGLVIHGLEGPGEAPYLSIDRIALQLKVINLFSRVVGRGLASHVSLNSLQVDHPQFHLIVDKDGHTNQPTPKHPSNSTTPITDTLLDLRAGSVELANGVALINDRAIPFDLAARDVEAEIHYLSHTDRYAATIDLKDLRTRLKKEPEAQSSLHVEAQLGRDEFDLERLQLRTGRSSQLTASGNLKHFGDPEWDATAQGTLELRQISVLTGVDGLNAGTIDLNLQGRNCLAAPPPSQQKPSLWRRLRSALPRSRATPSAPDDEPDCPTKFLVTGTAKRCLSRSIRECAGGECYHAYSHHSGRVGFDGYRGEAGGRGIHHRRDEN